MKDTNFSIKIADLLKQSWIKDSLSFSHKFSPEVELSPEGISVDIALMGLDDSSVLVTLSDIRATVFKTCDRCGTVYSEDVFVPETVIKAIVPTGEQDFIGEENEHAIIDTNEASLNLHDPIVQAIKFCDHVVNNCTDCRKIVETLDDEIPEIDWGWSIAWKHS